MIRRMMLRNLLLVAAILCSLSVAAAGKVEVTGNTGHGTVQSSVQGTVVTLTVTPADGYYIRKSDITASKSFMPVPEGRMRARSVPVSDGLTLVGNDPDDLSLPRTYTVTLPGEEYDVLLDVQYSERRQITEQMVTLSETLFVYNEQVQRPTVLINGLTEGVDYTVTYAQPASTASGSYSLTVQGRSMWQGSVERSYRIFSGGKAEVKKNITGGIVATAVDGLTLTLTVTPEDGYYIRKGDLTVEKTFMPVASERRTAPVSDNLTINGDDPDDLSLPRTYTVELPGWEYDALVGAQFQPRQRITASMVSLSATSYVYNGQDQKPVISVRGLTEGKDYLVSFRGTSWSDVGTYSVDIVGRSTWKETVTKTYTITKAPSVVTAAPEGLKLTYTGQAQTLISRGDAIGGTLLYGLDGRNYQTELPTATATGNYTVYYMVQGDKNHEDTEAKALAVSIGKKDIVVSGIQAQGKVYDGTTAVTLSYDAVNFGGMVEGDNLTVTAKGIFTDANAGTDKQVNISDLVLGGRSIANYQLAAEGQQTTAKADITPKSIENAAVADIPSVTYTGVAITPEASVTLDGVRLVSGTDFSVSYTDNTNVGTATITVNGQGNYQGMTTKTFLITKSSSAVTSAPLPLTLIYNGQEQTLAKAGEAMGGTMVYSLDGENYAAEIPGATLAGSYTIYYKVQGDGNHEDTEAKTLAVSIGKKDVVVSGIQAQGKVYDGTTAVTLSYDAVSFGGMVEGDNLTVTAKGVFADANAGTDKQVNISDLVLGGRSIANYQLAAEGQQTTTKATITPKGIEKAAVADIPSVTYTGVAITPEASVTLDGVRLVSGTDFSVSYTDNTNVGTATVTVTGQGNYQGMTTKTFLITKSSSAVTSAPLPLRLIYNGQEQTLAKAGEAMGGTMVYSLDGENYAAEIPGATVVGSYTIYYKVQGDGNHEDTEAKTLTVSIGKKDIVVSGIQAQGKVYDGTTAVTLSYDAVNFGGMVEGDNLTVTAKGIFTDANAGTDKQVNISDLVLGGRSFANYQLAAEGQQTTTKATVSKAASSVAKAPVPLDLTYTGTAQRLARTGEGTGGVMMYSLNKDGQFTTDIPTGTDAGEYILYYYVAGDRNHVNAAVESVHIMIAEKTIAGPVIELSQRIYVYDGKAKTPAVKVKDGSRTISSTEYAVSYEANVNAGEARVIVTDAEGGNYKVSGTAFFTIGKAMLSAIADNKMMEKGTPMPELTVRYKGFENNETEEVLQKKPVAICEEITDTVAGIYTVRVEGGEAANYDLTCVSGTLTVFVPQIMADNAGNEIAASVTAEEDTCHVVITELTVDMLVGKEEIPAVLKDGTGDAYQVTEVASEAFEEKPSSVIITMPDGVNTTNPVTNVINGDGTCETLNLTEADGFEPQKPVEVDNVVYERKIDNEVMTVCLPYDCPVPEGVIAYVMNMLTDGNVSFTAFSGDTLKAYQPYLIQPVEEPANPHGYPARRIEDKETNSISLGARNVVIDPAQGDAAVSAGKFKLCGTVKGLTQAEGYRLKAYVLQPDLTWRMTASGAQEDASLPYLAPFQAYLILEGGDGSEVIGEGIEDLTTALQVIRKEVHTDGWYDLTGRKLSGKPVKGGVYIYQGKKIRM